MPGLEGSFAVLGNAYPERSIDSEVGLYISKYLLLEVPSAYSEKNSDWENKIDETKVIIVTSISASFI